MKTIYVKFRQIVVALFPFFLVYLLTRAFLMGTYLPEWQVHNHFCYLWVVVSVIAFFKPKLAYAISYGNVLSIALGEVIGTAIRNHNISQVTPDMSAEQLNELYHHPGFEIWIFSLIGIVALYAIAMWIRKKYMKNDCNTML